MLVRTGRAVHPAKWVDEYVQQAGLDSFKALM